MKSNHKIDKILMAHGGGGILTRRLIEEHILPRFGNAILNPLNDCAELVIGKTRLAFTTDSYVVTPLFFHGGDIGKLAVCGTVNDLSMSGAKPMYLTVSLILEEGFPIEQLDTILDSISETAQEAGVTLVTGDTKVVERGSGNGVFINTAGIGIIPDGVQIAMKNAQPGDVVLINGYIGDHGIAIMSQREGLNFTSPVESDVAPLNSLVQGMLEITKDIHILHDPTRGGLSSGLNEIAGASKCGIRLFEDLIPVRDSVMGACDLLGLDPLQVANEGKIIVLCQGTIQDSLLKYMRSHPLGRNSAMIGEVIPQPAGKVLLKTRIGGERIVDVPYGENLPRIC
jgi:hydrogenase expression/formation protein HypE